MTRRIARSPLSIGGLVILLALLHCQNAAQSPLPEGRAIVFQGNSASTAIFDPLNLSFNPSADLPETLGAGASSFRISTGVHGGKVLTILGKTDNSTGKTYLYDPMTNRYSAGTPLTSGMAQRGVHFNNRVSKKLHLYSRNDAYVHAYDANNLAWTIVGPSVPDADPPVVAHLTQGSEVFTVILRQSSTTLYTHGTNNSMLLPVAALQIRAGANVSIISNGTNAGKGLLVPAGGLTQSYIIALSGGQIVPAPGPAFQQTPYPNLGSCSTVIESGIHAGKIFVVHGAASNVVSIYDANLNAFSAGPGLTAATGDGAHIVTITTGAHAGKFLVIHGNNSATTSLYEPSTGQFTTGPSLPFALGAGGHSVSLD